MCRHGFLSPLRSGGAPLNTSQGNWIRGLIGWKKGFEECKREKRGRDFSSLPDRRLCFPPAKKRFVFPEWNYRLYRYIHACKEALKTCGRGKSDLFSFLIFFFLLTSLSGFAHGFIQGFDQGIDQIFNDSACAGFDFTLDFHAGNQAEIVPDKVQGSGIGDA